MSWLDAAPALGNCRPVNRKERQTDRYQSWLRRTRRRLAASGGISQAAATLAAETGGDAGYWRTRLEALLAGAEPPTIELITRIDSLLATPVAQIAENPAQGMLFPEAGTTD
ncbi:MAG TPA: hypothetical protein VLO11_13905 [Luteolibacter sp.]|nr:hypothetical protein [Luteolibacter sp.]